MSAYANAITERVAKAIADQTGMGHRWTQFVPEARAASAIVIEECARVAGAAVVGTWPSDIADAIRAMKDKP